jgi:hypothetical protein
MRYMLLVYQEEQKLDDAEREHCYQESAELCRELQGKGQFIDAAPLYPTSTATSVRVRDDRHVVTDGPFAETREQLGGFYMVNARDLDEAIAIAHRIPGARRGTIEVRPVIELANLPESETARPAVSTR